jgi:hypothetical protein
MRRAKIVSRSGHRVSAASERSGCLAQRFRATLGAVFHFRMDRARKGHWSTHETRVLFRIASVLIVLLDLGHTSGYPWSDPAWGVDLHAVQGRFNVLGSNRTYWDFTSASVYPSACFCCCRR